MADCRSRDVNTGNMMAMFDVLSFAWFSAILCVVCGSVQDMRQDEIETDTFEVKPGAGRQEFARQWVCYFVF